MLTYTVTQAAYEFAELTAAAQDKAHASLLPYVDAEAEDLTEWAEHEARPLLDAYGAEVSRIEWSRGWSQSDGLSCRVTFTLPEGLAWFDADNIRARFDDTDTQDAYDALTGSPGALNLLTSQAAEIAATLWDSITEAVDYYALSAENCLQAYRETHGDTPMFSEFGALLGTAEELADDEGVTL